MARPKLGGIEDGAPGSEGDGGVTRIPVERYAGITAALAEGFSEEAVLAMEGVAAEAWPGVDAAWKVKLVDSASGDGALFSLYCAKLAQAEDWLARRVAPLDEDMAAWAGFLHRYSAHPAPLEMLAALGLRPSDIARLRRLWARRMEGDPALKKKAIALAKGDPPAVTSVSAGRAELKPFPWSRGASAGGAESGASAGGAEVARSGGEVEMDVAQYAALCAEIELAPVDAARVLKKHGLTEASRAGLERAWQARMAEAPSLRLDFRRLVTHHQARLRLAARQTEGAQGAPAAPTKAMAAPIEAIAAMAAPTAAPPSEEEVRAALERLAGTVVASGGAGGPALPFQAPVTPPAAAISVSVKPGRAGALTEAERQALDRFGATVDAPEGLGGPALPFGARPELPAPVKVEPTPRAPSKSKAAPLSEEQRQALERLAETAYAAEIPSAPALPFQPSATPPPRAKESEPSSPPSGQGIPLTLEQHASLCVEIALHPERVAETLARYRLTPNTKDLVDAHYKTAALASPEVRAAWDRAYETYHAWLLTKERGRD